MDKDSILNNFYANLDVIARIEDGHKLYLDKDQMIQLDEPFMFQGIWRYCYGVSRKDAIHILTKLFNDIEIYMNAIYLRNIDVKNSSYPRIPKSSPEQVAVDFTRLQENYPREVFYNSFNIISFCN